VHRPVFQNLLHQGKFLDQISITVWGKKPILRNVNAVCLIIIIFYFRIY